ncbi:MAG: A/G-specific adenine glycosylase [Alphaproteobacteria bacterium]|nr:A/G-specific adenine glycosylase [Alphaproteobacteria bacterium]MCW5741916.1 A/G-specific adenine glycosylase [Alphaproteobacteria bacterium]
MRLHAERLLAWYDRHRRVLPWRAPAAERADPYHVWLSEIMLQQTTVQTVGRYFLAFVERWPTVRDLAEAPLDDVLHLWQGLGYYARARNLHACARAVVDRHGGVFPDDEETLRALPGIGAYTSAAIAAIAFDRPASAVDGNVDRVVTRLHALDRPIAEMKSQIRALAARLVPPHRAGDYAQAMMDLGATVCIAGEPRCVVCPLMESCEARRRGIAGELPRRRVKPARPVRRGIAFFLLRRDGAILLRRRAPRGLLGGMMEVPSSEWREGRLDREAALRQAPIETRWRALDGVVRHVFTHFELELSLVTARLPTERAASALPGAQWCAVDRLGEMALPTVMKKVLRHAIMATSKR